MASRSQTDRKVIQEIRNTSHYLTKLTTASQDEVVVDVPAAEENLLPIQKRRRTSTQHQIDAIDSIPAPSAPPVDPSTIFEHVRFRVTILIDGCSLTEKPRPICAPRCTTFVKLLAAVRDTYQLYLRNVPHDLAFQGIQVGELDAKELEVMISNREYASWVHGIRNECRNPTDSTYRKEVVVDLGTATEEDRRDENAHVSTLWMRSALEEPKEFEYMDYFGWDARREVKDIGLDFNSEMPAKLVLCSEDFVQGLVAGYQIRGEELNSKDARIALLERTMRENGIAVPGNRRMAVGGLSVQGSKPKMQSRRK